MTQEIHFILVKKIRQLEICRCTEVILSVVQDNSDDSGFDLLFRYINGEKKAQRRIAMTTLVSISEKIAMIVLVITKNDCLILAISSSYTKETVPVLTNPAVKIETQLEKEITVLRFGDHATQNQVEKNIQRLKTLLQEQALQINRDPVLMRYNSPLILGF